jgi:peptidyl-prolyl cis-trans isomerase B (cyclophilin B)
MGKNQKIKAQRRLERVNSQGKNKNLSTLLFKIFSILLVLFLVGGVSYSIYQKNKPNEEETAQEEEKNEESEKPEIPLKEITVNKEAIKNKQAILKTKKGDIYLTLYSENAPKTVTNFIDLANQDFYNGTKFHRVEADFMIQGGDPNSKDEDPANDGTGGPGYRFADEINPKSLGVEEEKIKTLELAGYHFLSDLTSQKNTVGSIAMANSGPDTNGSQFFIITTKDQPHLDGKHTVFGKVTKGLDIAKKIEKDDEILEIIIK